MYKSPAICSMVLKQIITRKLQNHDEVVIDLPPTGLIVFGGQNSNGKSVIVKTTRSILNGDIRKPRKRAALVNRNSTFGEIIYLRSDDVKLTVHIAREANLTYFKYEIPEHEPIVRYLADKSYDDLIRNFGWHYDKESGISLNIAEEEDALLFYKTSNKINGNILHTATTDNAADKVSESFDATLKETRTYRENYIQQVRTMSSALNDLKIEEVNPLIEKKEKLQYFRRNLGCIYFPTIPEIKPVPKVHFVDVYYPNIPKVKYPRVVNLFCNIPDITPVAQELKTLKEHKCPTCGRGFDCDC